MTSHSSLIGPREAYQSARKLFTKQQIIGKGAYGAVYKAVHNSSRREVAIKVIELDSPESAEEDIIEIQREVALLSSLQAAEKNNCTLYHGCWLESTQLWLAMDYAAGGSIRTIARLMKSCTLEERFIAVIMRETLTALAYLHKQGIIHRDIKAANILLTSSGRIILCDFGVAAHLQSNSNKRSTFTGTPYWMAPEVIADGKLYDTKADIWSLGVTVFECATGNPPYAQYEALRAIQLIPKNPPAKLDANGGWSSPMRDFLAACLNEDPTERASAEDLQKTKWIKTSTKTPVSVLKELIGRYDKWISGGGIRNSIVGLDDSPMSDDSWAPESGWDYDSPLAGEDEASYTGSNLGTDLPGHRGSKKPSSQPPPKPSSSATNHPLMRLFEQEETPAPLVNAAAAADAYGLGFGLNASSNDSSSNPASQSKIAIPSFGGDSDEEDAQTQTMRGGLKPSQAQIDVSTVRGTRPQATPLPSSTSQTGSSGSSAHSNSLKNQEDSLSFSSGSATSSPPRSQRPAIRRGRGSSSDNMPQPAVPKTAPRHSKSSSKDSVSNPTPPSASSPSTSSSPPPPPPPASAPPPSRPTLKPWLNGPNIKPFNYAALGSTTEDVHSELEMTASDLGAWLGHLEGSLRNLLESTAAPKTASPG